MAAGRGCASLEADATETRQIAGLKSRPLFWPLPAGHPPAGFESNLPGRFRSPPGSRKLIADLPYRIPDVCCRLFVLMLHLLQFYWLASRGYRLHPWDSPYIQWRFETFLGKQADNLDAGTFFRLCWKYRGRFKSFSDWAATRRRAQRRPA